MKQSGFISSPPSLSLFNGSVQILAEEDIDGNRVHSHGHFEFVLKRGDKLLCIVEAKKEDLEQGKLKVLWDANHCVMWKTSKQYTESLQIIWSGCL